MDYRLDDLKDWDRVFRELEELKELQLLDEHQDGLKRILRYKGNWRLRECALECTQEVREPKNELLQEVCSIICDEDIYPELRMLAVETIRQIALRKSAIISIPYRGTTIFDNMKGLVGIPMHPLLQRRIVRAVEEIEAKEVAFDDGKPGTDK